jgi:hypothetical protein
VAYAQQYPWKVFAFALGAVLLLTLILKPQTCRGNGGDVDFGDGGE